MKRLAILTTNPEKQAQARVIFEDSGIHLDFIEFETPEIQAFTCEEVAIDSARFAVEKLKRPLAVTDAGYFIPALNGFPGPFLKYVNSMLSVEDLLQLMKGKPDRSIDLLETIAYIDERQGPVTFTSRISGIIASEPRGTGRIFDQLFIPDGYSKTAAELGEECMHTVYIERFTHWRSLKDYLQK